jgi:hypothetical protein
LFRKHFGKQYESYFKNILVICTDDFYSKDAKKCKKYIYNRCGIEYIKSIIEHPSEDITWNEWQAVWNSYYNNITITPTSQVEKKVHKAYVADYQVSDRKLVMRLLRKEYARECLSGNFTYTEKHDRMWHTLQFVPREYKRIYLAENHYEHMYDIDACAPTLLYQYALTHGLDKKLDAYEYYLNNKSLVRNRLASLINESTTDIKIMINALFCGARLGCNKHFALYHLFDKDNNIICTLKDDEYLMELIEDIKYMWRMIGPSFHVARYRYNDKEVVDMDTGELYTTQVRGKKIAMNSSDKWDLYFRLENRVGSCIRNYLKELSGIRWFFEHDGWSATSEIDTESLRTYVQEHTGFVLSFSYELIGEVQGSTPSSLTQGHQNQSVVSLPHDSSTLFSDSFSSYNNDNAVTWGIISYNTHVAHVDQFLYNSFYLSSEMGNDSS